MAKFKVLIVDDSLTIRAMLEALLSKDRDLRVVGSAADLPETLAMIRELRPNVLSLDINMPGPGGMTILEHVRKEWPGLAVVMLSSAASPAAPICQEAFDRGALACFDKSHMMTDGAKLTHLLKEAAMGRISRAAHRVDGTTLPDPKRAVASH